MCSSLPILWFIFMSVSTVMDAAGRHAVVDQLDSVFKQDGKRYVIVHVGIENDRMASVRWNVTGLTVARAASPWGKGIWQDLSRFFQWGVSAQGVPLPEGFVCSGLDAVFQRLVLCLQHNNRVSYDDCAGDHLTYESSDKIYCEGTKRHWRVVALNNESSCASRVLRVVIPGLDVMLEGDVVYGEEDTAVPSIESLWIARSNPFWAKSS